MLKLLFRVCIAYQTIKTLVAIQNIGKNTRPPGEELRELMKQPPNSPLTLPESIAIFLARINGIHEDIPSTNNRESSKIIISLLRESKMEFDRIKTNIKTNKKVVSLLTKSRQKLGQIEVWRDNKLKKRRRI
jgi:F0F1-type ATP synthase alpha subunit